MSAVVVEWESKGFLKANAGTLIPPRTVVAKRFCDALRLEWRVYYYLSFGIEAAS